mmetsp:Transcript_3489/g.6558  ORF Transcript_3489/g.6558 Transcript_3489/m.6558 type:complete len:491 (+) Transcript_3489:96-1568(+)
MTFERQTQGERDLELLGTLPALRETTGGPERTQLLITKLKLCERRCDFSNPNADFKHKEAKRKTLVEIFDYVNTTKGVFTEDIFEPLLSMITANLFRALPAIAVDDDTFDPEDDEPRLESAWPHLQIVYELLRRFVVSGETDTKLARKYFDERFILGILDLFVSEDPREREYLKNILHRIYGKFMSLRPYIRKSMMHVFFQYVGETQRHNGIAELLEILGSIINGFAVPLKEEHKDFLRKSLIPLHMPRGLPSHHVQLAFCVTQFVEKDPTLASDLILGLLKYWPVTHSRKEVMFLNELEEILELTQPPEFAIILDPLFRRLAKCLGSSHFQVAERALFFWNNEYIVNLIVRQRERVLPLVYGALRNNIEWHWNQNVVSLSFNVEKLLSEMDIALHQKCVEQHRMDQHLRKEESKARERRWRVLEKVGAAMKSGEEVTVIGPMLQTRIHQSTRVELLSVCSEHSEDGEEGECDNSEENVSFDDRSDGPSD